MTGWLTTGIIMGAVGSFHCIGMCGPLALSLPAVRDSAISRFYGTLLYNVGRVITYGLIGALLGMIGYSFVILGFQRWLTIGIGLAMLVYLFLPSHTKNFGKSIKALVPLRKKIAVLYSNPSYSSLFLIGVLNGLLPCGLVYAALAMAVAGGDMITSALFMAAFGAGTLPLMWAVSFFGSNLKFSYRAVIRKSFPMPGIPGANDLYKRGSGCSCARYSNSKIFFLSATEKDGSHLPPCF